MKKKIIALCLLMITFFYTSENATAQWPTIDVGAIAQQSALNSKLAQQILEQIKQTGIMDSVSNFAKKNLNIAKKYYEDILGNPIAKLKRGAITSPYNKDIIVCYNEVQNCITNIGFLSTLSNSETASSSEALNIGIDVATFMAYVKSEAEDISEKVDDAQKLEGEEGALVINSAERIMLFSKYEKEMRTLLLATQLYIIRAQRIIIGKKTNDNNGNQTFRDL
jgi:hypothetical protein